jgi:hypothetical protein
MPRATPAKWRGPSEPGEFPTLGWQIIDWIEANLVVPGGPQRGAPLQLTPEQGRHILHGHRLNPRAKVHPKYPRPIEGRVYYGAQLRRPQKWGKDPLGAALDIAAALGPVQWDGWDADGEPVGRPVSAPWVQVAATSDEQTDNTFQPIYRMLSEGPLANLPGLDIGETRIKLPDGDGWIEPVTAAARSRLGAPITHASFTEPHLMRARDGGLAMIKAMKRNLAGMGGDWGEYTNAWDPSEDSAAQLTAQAKAPGVYLDHRAADLPRLTGEEFESNRAVLERIVVKYGDSCRRNGGWVDERGILAQIRDAATGEAEARRYFLDEVTVGERDAVDALGWAARARPVAVHGGLEPREPVALGFDGSRYRDATALIACRISDGRWFELGIWTPDDYRTDEQRAARQPGKVPEPLVEQALDDAYSAYDVWYLIADPYLWQTVLDRKAGAWGNNAAKKPTVIEFPTNSERRMDEAITLWQTAFRNGDSEFTHDGSPTVTQHAANCAIALGGKKAAREDNEAQLEDRYKKLVKKKPGWLIDAYVAGVLATYGRGLAIEHGALEIAAAPNLW